MTQTLIAILVVLALSHYAPEFTRVRRFDWLPAWAERARRLLPERSWSGPGLLWAVLGLPLLVVLLVQGLLANPGVPALLLLLFGAAALFYVWGPRDLDRDVERIAATPPAEQPAQAATRLAATPPAQPGDAAGMVAAAAQKRWFGPLLWFVILGAVGAVGYRLLQLAADGDIESLTAEQRAAAGRLRDLLDWPVAQLMVLALAVATDFDQVLTTWKARAAAAGGALAIDPGLVPAAARTAVRADLAEAGESELPPDGEPGSLDAAPVLRDALAVIRRVLVVWLSLLALAALASLLA
ncbi:MAG: hypothetical protein KF823_14865 [Xanthomonadales bacterium]|nr:hypothetical protein [Xanthomonadales bacterium]